MARPCLFGSVAGGGRRQLPGALLLLLAICGGHFTAMGAVTVTPDPTVMVSEAAVPKGWLAIAVALASLAILLLAGAALALDVRDRRYAKLEAERLRSLANAAVEGLVICTGDAVVSANLAFARLVGRPQEVLAGMPLSTFLPGIAVEVALAGQHGRPAESELRRVGGEQVPVEIIMQPVEYAGRPHCAVAVRDLRARQQAERQIHFLAHHDPLTGLANRASFGKRLDQEMRAVDAGKRKLAVLCLDLDRFKEVNDLFGHAAGDAMLESVARLVTAELDDSQMLARLGGDEFAVLMPCDGPSEASRLAERILDASPGSGFDRRSLGSGPQDGDLRAQGAVLTGEAADLFLQVGDPVEEHVGAGHIRERGLDRAGRRPHHPRGEVGVRPLRRVRQVEGGEVRLVPAPFSPVGEGRLQVAVRGAPAPVGLQRLLEARVRDGLATLDEGVGQGVEQPLGLGRPSISYEGDVELRPGAGALEAPKAQGNEYRTRR